MADAVEAPTNVTFSDIQLRALSVLLDRQTFMRMAGLQFDGRRDLYNIFGYDRVITSQQYRDEYARGGIAKRIVDAFPKATWRGGVELYEDEDPKVSTPFEKAFDAIEKKHHVWNTLQNADILAGQSTYSVILIGAPGELDTELPKNAKLLYLQPFFGGGGPGDQGRSASTRTQASDADVSIQTFVTNAEDERFGEPLTYRIRRTDLSAPMFARDVHWSRVIHVCEGALDNNVYGVPTLESIWNLLFDLEKVTGGGAESFFQRAKHTLNANIQKDATFSPTDLAALKEKFEEYQHGITNFIPTREVDVKLIEAAVANMNQPADAILKQIAGTKGIPYRILTGSEMGTLASEQDAANFDSQVQDRRTGYAGPMIVRKLIDRLIEFGYLPTPKEYTVGWPLEENLDELGKADLALKMVQVNKEQGGVVFTEEEVREKSFDMEPLTDLKSSDLLSESQKAEVAAKLALVNKEMGITVFTDDEIRKITYDFSPLSDSEKVPIGAPEKISVTEPPKLGSDGQPLPQEGQTPPPAIPAKPKLVPRAAEDKDLLRVLETAIRVGNQDVVARIIGLATYKYGSTQVQLPPSIADKLIAFGLSIPDADIMEAEGGRETDAHVTVKYGLLAPDADALGNVQVQLNGRLTSLNKAGSVRLTLGKTLVFNGADYDVVVVDVKSEDLAAVNRAISAKVQCAPSSHPTYQPHATVAYVTAGAGSKYAGWAGLDGVTVYAEYVTLTDADGNRTQVPLG